MSTPSSISLVSIECRNECHDRRGCGCCSSCCFCSRRYVFRLKTKLLFTKSVRFVWLIFSPSFNLTATEDATAAALAVKADEEQTEKKGEMRRKRLREKLMDEDDDSENKPSKKSHSHEDQLASRRMKDRQRYASMTPEQRQIYNSKRREQYHRQNETSRHRRRERERQRYHSLTSDSAKERNNRRAKLERERYQRLTPEELEAKNRQRRERAAMARQKKTDNRGDGASTTDKSDLEKDEVTAAVVEEATKAAVEAAAKSESVEV